MADMVNALDGELACHPRGDGRIIAYDDAVLLDAAGPMRRLSQSPREPGFVQDPYSFRCAPPVLS